MTDMLSILSFGEAGWGDELLHGLLVTVQLAVVTLPFGLIIGFAIALMSLSQSALLRGISYSYSTVMRGMPEILTLFLVYNGVGLLLTKLSAELGPSMPSLEFGPFTAGVVALSMVFGAFASEVLRGAFNALNPGQIEAGRAVGMRKTQIFLRIEVPQLWRFALPGLGNLWISLIKDTALVSVIAINDLMRMTKVAVGVTKQPFTFYLTACLIYWGLCVISEVILARMEKRANRSEGRA